MLNILLPADRLTVQDSDDMDTCTVTWFVGTLLASHFSDSDVWYEGEHPGYITNMAISTGVRSNIFVLSILTTFVTLTFSM